MSRSKFKVPEDTLGEVKRYTTDREKTFTRDKRLAKGSYLEHIKNLIRSTLKKINTRVKQIFLKRKHMNVK